MKTHRKKIAYAVSLVFFGALVSVLFFGSTPTGAFSGPNQGAGTGNGAIGVDGANNLSVGTSTPLANTKLFLSASSSNANEYAIKIFQPDGSTIFSVRNDSRIGINMVPSATNTLIVNGTTTILGNLFAGGLNGPFLGSVAAANVSAGVFGSSTGGGNYAFPSSIGISTSSQVGLPSELSVYGDESLTGNLFMTVGRTIQLGNSSRLYSPNDGSGEIVYDRNGGTLSRLLNTGGAYFTGNVGIDISAPTSALAVLGIIHSATGGFRFPDGSLQTTAVAGGGGGGNSDWGITGVTVRLTTSTNKVGIGLNSATYKLDVAGDVNIPSTSTYRFGGTAGMSATCSAGQYLDSTVVAGGIVTGGTCTAVPVGGGGGNGDWRLSGTTVRLNTSTNSVGIGTNAASYKLDVVGDINSSAVFRRGGTAGLSTTTCSAGEYLDATSIRGGIVTAGNCVTVPSGGGGGGIGGSGTTNFLAKFTASSTLGNSAIFEANGGRIGIGTSTPQALLSVGTTTASLVAIFGGGSGKIDAGTVDPLYTIGGKPYATYLPGMTGVKEETTGVATCQVTSGKCQVVLDVVRGVPGSDLWLFGKSTSMSDASKWDALTVLLTPNFDGHVWYEKDAKNGRLTIFAQPLTPHPSSPIEVSYRLTAPRFDSADWPNSPSNPSGAGFIIP